MKADRRTTQAVKPRTRKSSSGAPSRKTDKPTKHEQDNLDESLQETFPASDPIAPATRSDQPAKKKRG